MLHQLRAQCTESVNKRIDKTDLPQSLWDKVDKFLRLPLPPQLMIRGTDQKMQNMLTFGQFYREMITSQHWHEGCTFHQESLLEHLLMTGAFCAQMASERNEPSDKIFASFLTGFLHDIAKPVTNHINQMNQPSYWGHSVVGALMLESMYPPDAIKLGLTADHWRNIVVATNFHMCRWRTGLLSTLPNSTKPYITYLRYGDKVGRECKNLDEDVKRVLETQEEYEGMMSGKFDMGKMGKGCLIMVNGMSGSGKSTLSRSIIKYLSSSVPEKDILYLSRDESMIQWFLEKKQPGSENKEGSLYALAYVSYETEKPESSRIINERIRTKLTNALRLGKIVVLDTVANLFGSIHDLVGGDARYAFKLAVFCRRGNIFTQIDANRIGLSTEKQVKLHGDICLFTQPYRKHIRWKTLVSQQELRGKTEPPSFQPHISLAYGWTGLMLPVLNHYLDKAIEIFLATAKVWSLPTVEETTDLTLCKLVQVLYDGDGLTAIEDFLKPLGYHIKKINDVPLVIGIKYIDGVNFIWKPKWARQARGSFFGIIDEKVCCLKMLLQRGVELLGKSHLDSKIEETQDYSMRTLERLDDTQQQLAKTFATGGPMNAYITSKKDGSLIGVNIYPRRSKEADLMRKLLDNDDQKEPFLSVLIKEVDEKKLDFLPIICTQGTLRITDNMVDYLLTALVIDHKKIDRSEIARDLLSRLSNIRKCVLETAPGSDQYVMSLSFEAVCPLRTTYNGEIHTELTVSYKQSHFDFLGVTVDIGTSKERYIPHFDIRFDTPVEQPLWRKVAHTKQVYRVMADLDRVVKNEMRCEEFISTHFDNQKNVEIDFEGFVLLAPKLDGSYDYSKIKTTLYYYSHKVREENISALLSLPDSVNRHYPTVSKLKKFYRTIEKTVPYMIDDVHRVLDEEISKKEKSSYYELLPSKAKDKFDHYDTDILKRIYMNVCSDLFLSEASMIVEKSYKVCSAKSAAEWLRRLVMTTKPFGKCSVNDLIEKKDRVVTDLYILLLPE